MENNVKSINEVVKSAIQHCVELYKDDEGFQENIGDTLHENLSANGIFAKDEVEFRTWEKYAFSLLE